MAEARFHPFPSPLEAVVPQVIPPSGSRAVRMLVTRVRDEVDAELVQASLFGSFARGDARDDSDVDVLLVFRRLPPDREPQAGHAEALAEEVAAETGIPVTVWSVSLVDLERGNRTPMLVDALADSLPIWYRSGPLPAVPFTRSDALRCAAALLDRVCEGGEEFAAALHHGHLNAASRRARDDVVRLCTSFVLLRGFTRPRRAEAIRAAAMLEFPVARPPRPIAATLEWAIRSFGHSGRDEDRWVSPPPGGYDTVAEVVDDLRRAVIVRANLVYGVV